MLCVLVNFRTVHTACSIWCSFCQSSISRFTGFESRQCATSGSIEIPCDERRGLRMGSCKPWSHSKFEWTFHSCLRAIIFKCSSKPLVLKIFYVFIMIEFLFMKIRFALIIVWFYSQLTSIKQKLWFRSYKPQMVCSTLLMKYLTCQREPLTISSWTQTIPSTTLWISLRRLNSLTYSTELLVREENKETKRLTSHT